MSKTMSLFPEVKDASYEKVKPYIMLSFIFCFTATLLAPLLYMECLSMYEASTNNKQAKFKAACSTANFIIVLGLLLSGISIVTMCLLLKYYVLS